LSNKGPVALGLTLLEQTEAAVALRWIELLRAHPWLGPVYNGKGQYVVQARNIVLEQAFADKPENWSGGLLFWDADQIPPMVIPGPLPDDPGWSEPGPFTAYIDHVAETSEDVTGGLYYSRITQFAFDHNNQVVGLPHEPVAYERNEDGTYRHLSIEEMAPRLQRRGRYKVRGIGTGSMLIPQSILFKMRDAKHPDPIFEAPTLGAGEKGGVAGRQWTEDLYFCHQVEELLGGTIWLDTAMESGHLAKININTQHYLAARGVFNQRNPALDQRPTSKIWTPAQRGIG
jgi:hypothetical protein